jgi:hypothetical protein
MPAERVTSRDTPFHGLRRAAGRLAHDLDHAIGRRLSPLRVLVDVRTPMNLAVLRPVWKALTGDQRVRVAFTAEEADAVGAALDRDGLRHALIPRPAAAWRRWDLALSADAWNTTALRRCRRRMQFFHGVAGKYDLDAPERLAAAGFDTFDRIAFINEDRRERYLRAGVVTPSQAVLIGFPKLDALVNGEWPTVAVRRHLGLDPAARTVLYAPTFSTAGSLHLAGEAIVRTLLDIGVNVIIKLHDRSMVPHPLHTAGIDWPERLAPFTQSRRCALVRDPEIGPLLAAADVLVTDHSTVGFEFALLDRPIVIFDAPDLLRAARIDPAKWAFLRSMGTVVSSPDGLAAAVTEALAQPAAGSGARRQASDLFAHAGTATARALAVVYQLLEVAPAGTAGAGAPLAMSSPVEGTRPT